MQDKCCVDCYNIYWIQIRYDYHITWPMKKNMFCGQRNCVYVSVSVNVCQCLSVSVSVCQCIRQRINSVSINVGQCLSVTGIIISVNVCQCLQCLSSAASVCQFCQRMSMRHFNIYQCHVSVCLCLHAKSVLTRH